MKPSIGRKIYVVDEKSISAATVYAIGEKSFVTHEEQNFAEWRYDDYNDIWFTSIGKAEQQLLKNHKEALKKTRRAL